LEILLDTAIALELANSRKDADIDDVKKTLKEAIKDRDNAKKDLKEAQLRCL
jgi:hypothetical protein